MESVLQYVIPSLVKDGVFSGVKFVNLLPEDDTDIGAQYASSLAFFRLTVEGPTGEEVVLPLVIKLPIEDPKMRVARNCDAMFHNEVTMYKEILPGLGANKQMYTKIHYGIATAGANPESNLLIMENLKYKGFVPSTKKVFLDFSHISLAIKKIAEFHSLSYKLKHESRDRFTQLSEKLKSVVLAEYIEEEFAAFAIVSMERGIKALLKTEVGADVLEKTLLLLKCPQKLKKLISAPEEPFAVICHGDFCNNNVLFKYDPSGEPIDCILFDFQLSHYASPAIDIFFFLYMHTTSSFREKYWDDIIKMYWNTLTNSLPNHINIPTFEEYLKHFGKRAIYGYFICSWFLPVLTADFTITAEEHNALNFNERMELFATMGGEKSEKIISEVVLHLLNKNYINEFLNFCNEQNFQC